MCAFVQNKKGIRFFMNNIYQNNSPINLNSNNAYRSNLPERMDAKKFNFKTMKNNTITSLNDVEHFFNNLQHTIKYIKLYKLLK